MIVVLTSNYNAGILQLAVQMKNDLKSLYEETVLFVPEESGLSGKDIQLYKRKSSLLPLDNQYRLIARRIEKCNPTLVFVCDSNLITGRIVTEIDKNIPVMMVVHDVVAHPNYTSKSVAIKEKVKKPYVLKAWDRCNQIVLLSRHSYNDFNKLYPKYREKTTILRLGAHVPNAEPEKPEELADETGYILFFGRIDKYKGLIRLLKAYDHISKKTDRKLIIAGNGTVTDEEKNLAQKNKDKVILLNRYISDGEMLWLFQNTSCTVLPYIEASQSGVLSMSYYFGKPVIVSNLEGLTEFVEDGKTGAIFKSAKELAEDLLVIPENSEAMSKQIDFYYKNNLEWKNNLKKILNKWMSKK